MRESNEQWKLGGNCSLCRRKNYCSKPCTANKRRTKAIVYNAVDNATGGLLSYMNSKVRR